MTALIPSVHIMAGTRKNRYADAVDESDNGAHAETDRNGERGSRLDMATSRADHRCRCDGSTCHGPRNGKVDVPDHDDDQRTHGNDTQEGGDLKLLQQISRAEKRRKYACSNQQDCDDHKTDYRRGRTKDLSHQRSIFNLLRLVIMSMAPTETAAISTSPSNSGCAIGGSPVKIMIVEIVRSR